MDFVFSSTKLVKNSVFNFVEGGNPAHRAEVFLAIFASRMECNEEKIEVAPVDTRYSAMSKGGAFKAAEKLYKACSTVDDALALGAIDLASTTAGTAYDMSISEVEVFGQRHKAYSLTGYDGAYVIAGVLPRAKQVELAYSALSESLAPPNRTNLHCHYAPEQIESDLHDIWRRDGPSLDDLDVGDGTEYSAAAADGTVHPTTVFSRDSSNSSNSSGSGSSKRKGKDGRVHDGYRIPAHLTLSKVRWATLGYQYDWTARSYERSAYCPFPAQLGELAATFAAACGVGFTITPEAGIVNLYPAGQVMGGHVDDGEEAKNSPVVSMSLGPPCIFLLGGHSKDEPPAALLLRSGDVLILGGKSRLKYHGVPKVFVSEGPPADLLPSTAGLDPIHRSGCPCFLFFAPAAEAEAESLFKRISSSDVPPGRDDGGSHCSCGLVEEQEVCRALKVLSCARINVNLRQVYK